MKITIQNNVKYEKIVYITFPENLLRYEALTTVTHQKGEHRKIAQ